MVVGVRQTGKPLMSSPAMSSPAISVSPLIGLHMIKVRGGWGVKPPALVWTIYIFGIPIHRIMNLLMPEVDIYEVGYYIILSPQVFCDAYDALSSFSAPDLLVGLRGVYTPPIPYPTRHLWRLAISSLLPSATITNPRTSLMFTETCKKLVTGVK